MDINLYARKIKGNSIKSFSGKESGCGDIKIFGPDGTLKQTLKISDEIQKSLTRLIFTPRKKRVKI